MKMTILGNSAAYPGPGGACSGFLVAEGKVNLLVDCGTGVVGNLQKHLDLRDVTDIIVTHMHADHFIDLIPYRYALRYGLEPRIASPVRLHLPPDGHRTLAHVVEVFAESETFISEVFQVTEYDPASPLNLGPLTIGFVPVRHYIPAWGLTIASSRKLAYSSDSGLCPELQQVADQADLFICNIGACLESDSTSFWGHLRATEAGGLAREAGAKRLLLSHLWPDCKRGWNLGQANKTFDGPAEIAEVCRTYDV